MMIKKIIFAGPIALGASLMLATPASAAGYSKASDIRIELRQLDRQIGLTRGLSKREEASLGRKIDNLQSIQRAYARHGYSNVELRQLSRRLTSLKAQIRTQARDSNKRAKTHSTRRIHSRR